MRGHPPRSATRSVLAYLAAGVAVTPGSLATGARMRRSVELMAGALAR